MRTASFSKQDSLNQFPAVSTKELSQTLGGKWVYWYSAGPYAFYKNTRNGAIKSVQTQDYFNYTLGVIEKGWGTFHP